MYLNPVWTEDMYGETIFDNLVKEDPTFSGFEEYDVISKHVYI